MLFLLVILLIAIAAALLPIFVPKILRHFGIKTYPAPSWIPIFAAFIFLAAPFFPDIGLFSETDTFQWHFTGGAFTALLYIYLTRLIGWRPHWGVALIALFAWTSALGVINELFEFALTKSNILHIDISDTSWDLVANTSGSFTVYVLYALARIFKRSI